MKIHAIPSCLCLLALTLGAATAAAQVSRASTTIPTTNVRGTLNVSGCELPAQQIELVADLVDDVALVRGRGRASGSNAEGVVAPAQGRAAEAASLARLRSRRATVTALPDGHSYTVEFTQLADKRLYRLSIGVPTGSCGRIFWRGPHNGLIVAGDASPRLEGFAARTRLEILELPDRAGDNTRTPAWLGMDDLQFADAARAKRILRWRTDLPDVVSGELQISVAPFPAPGASNPCAEPDAGVVFRQRVAANGRQWARLAPIDFSQVLSVQRSGPLTEQMQERLLMGAPLYMRVVPHTLIGPLCEVQDDGVHGQVVVAKLPAGNAPPLGPLPPTPILTAASNQVYAPAYFPPPEHLGHPNHQELAYIATSDHKVPPFNCYTTQGPLAKILATIDPMGCVLVHTGILPPGGTLLKGQWFYVTPNGSSGSSGPLSFLTDTLGPLVTGVIGAAGTLVNFVSQSFEQIKNSVADVVVAVIESSGLGPLCDGLGSSGLTTCEGLVKTGLEVGLASVGVPPSIPSWDELKQQGTDYLAAQLAAQIAGNSALAQTVTEEVIKKVAEHAIDQMTANRNAALGPTYDWLLPYFGFDPASWTMSVAWTGSAPLPTQKLFIERHGTNLFEGGFAALPTNSLIDGSELRIPTILPPNYEGIPNPYCVSAIGQVTCTPMSWLSEPRCVIQITVPNGTLVQPYPCAPQTLAIYFRNAWYFRQAITQCVPLTAVSKHWVVQAGAGGNLQISALAPNPPFVDIANVGVRDPAVWSGPVYEAPQCQ